MRVERLLHGLLHLARLLVLGEGLLLRAVDGLRARRALLVDEPPEHLDLRARLDRMEKEMVENALAANGWNQTRASEALSLTYDQMRGLVRKHGLKPARGGGKNRQTGS